MEKLEMAIVKCRSQSHHRSIISSGAGNWSWGKLVGCFKSILGCLKPSFPIASNNVTLLLHIPCTSEGSYIKGAWMLTVVGP